MNLMNLLKTPALASLCAVFVIAGTGAADALTAQTVSPAAVADSSSCAPPVYPKLALRMEAVGTVTLEFRIGADGKVIESRVRESSGTPLLDAAAQSAMEKCRFKPALIAGKLADSWTPVKYVWSLEGPSPKAPVKPAPFAAAPAPARAFILAAKRADAIADPLQRCLAFPDFPGNKWPAGLAQSYCHLLFGERIGDAVIADHIERGATAELETMYRRDLERHLSKANFSEVIHRDFSTFHADDRSERLTRLWLEKAPDSPFANVARAEYLTGMAREARGGKWISETPKASLMRMDEFATRATQHYSKALRIEPRMQHALIGLVYLSGFATGTPVLDGAFARAQALDPACRYLSKIQMTNLQPRWGGSMADMHAYASSLQPYIAARPFVALSTVLPAMEEARILPLAEKAKKSIPILEPATLLAPYPDLFEELGMMMDDEDADTWETLVRFLVAYRYDEGQLGAARGRGKAMLEGDDPAWALTSVLRGHALKPESPYSNYLVGKAYFGLGKFAKAEPFLVKAMEDKGLYKDALYHLAYATFNSVQVEKAERYADLLVKTYPTEASAWYLSGQIQAVQGFTQKAAAAYAGFLERAGSDKEFAAQADFARGYIKHASGAGKGK
jgi:TonB family protein